MRHRHPDYDDRTVRLAATRLAIGDEIVSARVPRRRSRTLNVSTPQHEFLCTASSERLEAARIPFMVSGSLRQQLPRAGPGDQ